MAATNTVPPSPKHIRMGDEHRLKIANSNLLNVLLEHAMGDREMSSTQVTAALGLLKKALPDLQSVNLSGDVGLTVTLPRDAEDL